METVRKYKVSIFGEPYFLISDESEGHIAAVAQLVDNAMRDIAEKSQISDSKRIAVLVALQCASKMVNAQHNYNEHQSQNIKLIEYIEQEMSRFNTL